MTNWRGKPPSLKSRSTVVRRAGIYCAYPPSFGSNTVISMKSRTLQTSVINRCLVPAFAVLYLSMGLTTASEAFVRDSLVRVVLKRQTSGLLHDGRLISEAQVLEVSELTGIMLDGRGYIVAYIGHHSEKLGASG